MKDYKFRALVLLLLIVVFLIQMCRLLDIDKVWLLYPTTFMVGVYITGLGIISLLER